MRTRTQKNYGEIPEINLIPMMNVMMGILAFFVMITATLRNLQAVDVSIPSSKASPSPHEVLPEPMIVELEAGGRIPGWQKQSHERPVDG
jgi:Biopolymer transport protein